MAAETIGLSVLMITEEDIEQLLTEWANVPVWIKAHVSARCPAHRYEGELLIDDERLVFDGRDIKEAKDIELEIPLDTVTDVYVGFSQHLQASIDPAFGIGGAVPFAIRYKGNGKSQTIYFNTSSNNYVAHRNISNRRWYETLDEIVTTYRQSKLAIQRNRSLVTAQ